MILGVDARTVYQPLRRGTGKNLIDLYRHASRLRPDWRFVMFHRGQGGDDPFADRSNVQNRAVDIPGDRWDLWQQVRLPLAARKAHLDVLHCPANTAPRRAMVPMVVTIHDLIPLDERFATEDSRRWGANVAQAARTARRIVTPSRYTRQRIVETFGVPADKVIVNPWAPDSSCRRVTDAAELSRTARRYGLDPGRPYVLAFGGADPRKNTAGLLGAWAALPDALRREHQLLVVGIQDRAREGFTDQARQLGLSDGCLVAGFAPEEDIPALLSGAVALCYPSLSEGFGLPVLDALVCRTPVLTSNVTSLPEVAGDAAVLVDPTDPGDIARGLQRLLGDEVLRSDLVQRGATRAAAFTWQACAERICSVFEDVMREVA